MPNIKTHIKAGAATGFVSGATLNLIEQQRRMTETPGLAFNWQEFFKHCLLGLGTGIVGGVLPDVLEPATHPNHRGMCHSLAALLSTGYGAVKASSGNRIEPYLRTVAVAGCAAYVSHLILDGETPKGVPLL